MENTHILFYVIWFLQLFGDTEGNYSPVQGFFVAINNPAGGRKTGAVYLYALHSYDISPGEEVTISKEGGLLPETVETGIVEGGQRQYGCFLKVGLSNRLNGVRYGFYTAEYKGRAGDASRYGFVKTISRILDTRGLYTTTVFPAGIDSKELEPSPGSTIGVAWTPGCRSIVWSKGKRGVVNRGHRLQLNSVDDAGLYTIRRRTRAKRGFFSQILVIVSSCPEGYFLGEDACSPRDYSCHNGGAPRDNEDECTCSPYFGGDTCSELIDLPRGDPYNFFIISDVLADILFCGDLPGGNRNCRGILFCFGDLYGCKCAPGWWGNNCDRPCPKGLWGSGCELKCPLGERDCNRFIGTYFNSI